MTPPDTTNATRLGEAVCLSVQKLAARKGGGVVRAAMAGEWSPTAEHDLVPRCVVIPGVELVRIAPEEMTGDCLANARTGTFDVAGLAAAEESPTAWLKQVKPLLKRGGYLFVEVPCANVTAWKESLRHAGFRNITGRDGAGSGGGLELLMARSDGHVRTTTAVANETGHESAASHPANGDAGGSLIPAAVAGSGSPAMAPSDADCEAVARVLAKALRRMLALAPGDLNVNAPFTEYGIDSIGGVALVNEINRQFHSDFRPTILFDYASLNKLAAYIASQGVVASGSATSRPATARVNSGPPTQPGPEASAATGPSPGISREGFAFQDPAAAVTDIAIIGMSGRFPGAENVDAFWSNLRAGKNSISEVPGDRWDHRRFFDPTASGEGKTKYKWGGFLSDADKFDPLFFNISGREAEAADPQHRLFLEETYHALEDAGYAGPSAGLARKCGVFAGVEPGDYLHRLMDLRGPREHGSIFQGNAESILAARIAYFLDLKGPGLAVNTACSSSLVAIHLACQSLIHGECDLALAGGVRVFSSEKAYLALGQMGMLSADGQCRTFDENANGFVPGEAVGVLVLKPLAAALRDGDSIRGVIRGSAINQDGRTNGITAPSSLAQTEVQREVYRRFRLDPGTFQYVEAHGTGTKLGDPIEIHALTQSFRDFNVATGHCAIGSVKTNIGHTMAAAGVCAVIKVLLAMREREIPPSLNLVKPNPYIDFTTSPFVVNTAPRPWPQGRETPRRAAVNSFGFSGTNSHLVLEEAPSLPEPTRPAKPAWLIPLSGRTAEALRANAARLAFWLEGRTSVPTLEDISFTLHVGRGHFAHRVAIVAASVAELLEALRRVAEGTASGNIFHSTERAPDPNDAALLKPLTSSLLRDLLASLHHEAGYREKLNALAALYAKGFNIDGGMLHEGGARRRISLPGYAFARERYWVESDSAEQTPPATAMRLHPLLHRNISTVARIQFVTALGEDDFVLREHRIRGQGVLPGVAHLEMALVAAKLAGIAPAPGIGGIAWLRPLTEDLARDILLRVTGDSGGYGFEITSRGGEMVHSRGVIMADSVSPGGIHPIAVIQERCIRRESPMAFYQICAAAGLGLGDRFQSIREIGFGSGEALAWLSLPDGAAGECAQFQLHPGLLDGAFQTAAMLVAQKGAGLPVPCSLTGVQVHAPLVSPCFAHVRSVDFGDGEPRCDITLLDTNGITLAELQGLRMQALPGESAPQVTWVRPQWEREDRFVDATGNVSGKVLLFQEDSSAVSPALGEAVKGVTFMRVRSAPAWEVQGEVVGLRFDDAEDMERLVRYFQPRFAIFDCAGPATQSLRKGGAVAEVLQPILSFTQALIRVGTHEQVRLMAHVGLRDEALAHAFAGFARTLRLESPNLRLSVVQADETCAPDVLLAEWRSGGGDGHVRLTLEERQTQTLKAFSPVAAGDSPLRNQGVYLVTGGLGAIGRTLARYLARSARARLALVGRSAWEEKNASFFRELESLGAEPAWFSADVSRGDQVATLIEAVKSRFGCIHGIIHAAGVVRDGFLLKKTTADFAKVLAVKAAGAEWLDLGTRDEPLDFFASFSSMAAVLGNIGQADYAAANGYLHGFALHREALRRRGERRGRTVSIAWPLWRDGGMGGNTDVEMRKLSGLGLASLDNATALEIFETALTTGEPWVMPLFGDPAAMTRLLRPAAPGSSRPIPATALSPATSAAVSGEIVFEYLAGQFSGFAKIPANRIEKKEPLEKYGIDSIMMMEFTQRLEKDFGELSKTLLFEYQTLGELAGYFRKHHASRLQALLQAGRPATGDEAVPKAAPVQTAARMAPTHDEGIAIVGLFGRFPMAEDMDEFWANLRDGRDCITEIPDERWDYRLFHDPVRGTPGKTVNKWGGFLKDVAHFDATFFGVTPREAFALDPQERLFLETVWRTVEDAGYRKSALANRAVGVFAGVMYGQYQLYGAGDVAAGEVFPLDCSSYASIANRVSYFFNWHGPSMAVDTMCSSSLTAIHLACGSIRQGECELAIAGGVNVTIHPHKDALLAPGGFAASDGRCRSFGEGGDGYVPGEGVGAVLLKPLAQARADGDHIYGIVRGSSVNHGGKTNGYTVPNPRAQGEMILAAMTRGGVTPEMVTCVEAHGTGTSLGDPVELTGLTKAFREASRAGGHPARRCALGSVKSNIGHLESAAGIAGVAKVLLQMRHGQLVPSLHSSKTNPHLRLGETPFFIPQELQAWESPGPRLAGISSFGAGGANAHLILQEGEALPARGASPEDLYLFILSARSEDRLLARARQIEAFLNNPLPPGICLEDIAWTLQTGREPMEERLAWSARNQAEALAVLRDYLTGTGGASWHHGTVRPGSGETAPWWEGEEGRVWVESLVRQRKWEDLGRFWANGGAVAWENLYTGRSPRRAPLPTYPFAGERYWAPDHLSKAGSVETVAATAGPSEPLFLRPVWHEAPAPTVPPNDFGGRLWIFDHDAALAQLIASRFPQFLVMRIGAASGYSTSDGCVTLDPARTEDYRRLVATGAPRYVIHRWAPADGNAEETRRLGIGSLFHLTQALGLSGLEETVRLLYCHSSGTSLDLAAGAFLRSVGQEQPLIDGRVVQVDGVHEDILREFFAKPVEREIRLHDHSRKVRSFEKFDPSGSAIALRTGGTFLITGGLGGLGYLFAEYLATCHQARLVLTGRSALTDETQARLASLNRDGARVIYVRGDVASTADVGEAVSRARAEFGAIHGIIHAAGVLRDSFLLRKEYGDLEAVLAPKLDGAECLDLATSGESLDFFVCMSSTAGVFGNAGQCDYAFANAALDAFAHRRGEERRAGRRQGRTLSINWSLWKDGGMSMAGRHVEAQLAHVGLHPLPRKEGIVLFERALACGEAQVVPLWGDARRLARTFLGPIDEASRAPTSAPATPDLDDMALEERTRGYLATTLAAVTQLPVDRLDADQRFEEFGVDSIVVGDFNMRLERDLGPVSKTLLFEHPNLRKLGRHLAKVARSQLRHFFASGKSGAPVVRTERESVREAATSEAVAAPSGLASTVGVGTDAPLSAIREIGDAPPRRVLEDIAIIGLAGRYPKAPDLRAFWNVLKDGIDCVTEIPKDRWDIDAFYDADPARAVEGRIYARWGAFLDDVDKFDPLFFNIAPIEAEAMDPQERLFLETAWSALEDAGYTRRDLARGVRKEFAANVGVFAGMTTSTYGEIARDGGGSRAMPTTLPWSLANRVSYLFNFNGPSMPVDTACSSSLTAIHLACEAIRSGQCQQAIAGGVNLYLHPSKYVNLCVMRMLSTDGKCRAFGAGGDGFVPGEGVGVVVLKPLSLAVEDGDAIYGVIKGTAINHGGRTNGYTVPNPAAQSELITRALERSGIEPDSLGYLEAHGTGTALGDPIELAGLSAALTGAPRGACALGSVKTNIGHLESAAGIAGLTKVLLQMKHRQLAPSLHARQTNPNLDFGSSPFTLQRELAPWIAPERNGRALPRRAGISSFGAGGSNAHVIVEEYATPPALSVESVQPEIIVLSARKPEALRTMARHLAVAVHETPEAELPLRDIAGTLQIGREAMEERVAFVVSSRGELHRTLLNVAAGREDSVIRGRVKREKAQTAIEDGDVTPPVPEVAVAIGARDLLSLARLWADGAEVDWAKLRDGRPVRRAHLPGYVFSRQRYWIPTTPEDAAADAKRSAKSTDRGWLHPLLEFNRSTFAGQVFASRWTGEETVLAHHVVGGRKVFPAAASLELSLAAACLAMQRTDVALHRVVWLRTIVATETGAEVMLRLGSPDAGGRSRFELFSGNEKVMEGWASPSAHEAGLDECVDLAALRSRCGLAVDVADLYRGMAERGLVYGPGFRSLLELAAGSREVWGRLHIPEAWRDAKFRLHPALVDGAFQSLAPLTAMPSGGVPGAAGIPFALEEAACVADHLPARCEVWGRIESVGQNGVVRYDIRIVDSDTRFVAARLRGLSVRSFAPGVTGMTGAGTVSSPSPTTHPEPSTFFCRPVWIDKPATPRSLKLEAGDVILVFDDEPAAAEMLSRVADGAHTVLRVACGSAWSQAGDGEVTIYPNEAGDYERLLRLITEKGRRLRAVLHLWSRADANRDEALVRGWGSVHLLVQALLRTGQINARIVFGYANGIPVYEAVGGYGKTLRQEQPQATFTAVGYDSGTPVDWAVELAQAGDEREVRWLPGGWRQSLSLEHVVPASGTRIEENFPVGGVYLITGGGGGLGHLFARHLVERRGGRVVLMGRSGPSATVQEWLRQSGDRAIYYRGDVGSAAAARAVFAATREKFGRLDGVLHAAGVLRDKLIFNLSRGDLDAVLHAKLAGAEALLAASADEAAAASRPRWMVFFSSTAGLLGSAGQGGYAFANACLDGLARRETAGRSSPRVVSVNWPLWKDGGMQAPEPAIRRQEQELGISPLETGDGIAAMEMILASGLAQCAVFSGTPSRFYRALGLPFARGEGEASSGKDPVRAPANVSTPSVDPDRLMDKLKSQVARVLRLDPSVLEADTGMSEYGFDSITLTGLANGLNSEFGIEITPATLFEYATLRQLSDFLLRDHGASVAQKLDGGMSSEPDAVFRANGSARTAVGTADDGRDGGGIFAESSVPTSRISTGFPEFDVPADRAEAQPSRKSSGPSGLPSRYRQEPMAIIGMSGVFPGSPDLAAFWRHIDEGKDLITRASRERWDFAGQAAPWGGFLAGIESFDPLFFGISPREAELMDPQQRLFLQTVWHLLEDAGYPRAALAGTKTGVFVGVSANDYANLLAMEGIAVEAYSSTGNAHSVLANRVSYFLDIHGPSEALDTACSSSLVAIHRAIESISSGSSEMAIVGGVNVLLSPGAFLAFGKAGMLGDDGRCKSFDASANGYVRGEGVGAILLKPLSLAERDGDRIHAIILGSAENHGGRVQSLTVPNPHAQARVLRDAFARAGIDPYTIGCIEAHGTGTSLGDPIEINGLVKAFGANSGAVPAPRCAVGSVKTNIGHLETAAGIAGVIKMLLALRHRRIPGNAHLRRVNPYIQVQGTPFWFPRESAAWEVLYDRDGRPLPRRAGVSSFGFGGANAHVVLEEYSAPPVPPPVKDRPGLFILSACNTRSLRENASRLVEYLRGEEGRAASLGDLAFTLQTGREAMEERFAVIASSRQELLQRMEAFLADEKMVAGLAAGNVSENKPALQLLRQVHENDDFLDAILQAEDWPRLAKLWVNGLEIPWAKMWEGLPARRIGLPGYAFSRQRCWVPTRDRFRATLDADQTGPLAAAKPAVRNAPESGNHAPAEGVTTNHETSRRENLVKYLIDEFAAFAKMDPTNVRAMEPLEKYGLDSIMAVEFSARIEGVFGPLPKTLLFEYPALDLLAGYLEKQFPAQVAELPSSAPEGAARPESTSAPREVEAVTAVAGESAEPPPLVPTSRDIAIIGLSGRFPQADTLEEFWANLVAGKDSIEEIPGERWDYHAYFDPGPGVPGTSYNKWGGFLRDVDKFDPLFFGISPREAEILDPQERLFLETVWQTLEDAGYPQSALAGRKGGVFVGVMYGQYQLFGAEESARSGQVMTLSSSYASIANRVSWFFDWHGPSLALDAMCSSALQSVHLACESLLRGESEFAIAGGVNLILHPHKEIGLAQAGFLNREGRCRSFGRTEGRGYIAGEGVGAVMLKPLAAALRDGDQIHGIIKGSASNHGGRTNNYATPNLHAQAAVTAEALRVAGVDPRTITCVEAAATGSAVGDALEVRGLVHAFGLLERNRQFCALGSVKSNIGHLEAASGMAGLAKVLLQMKHRQLAPSLHTAELNPDVDWRGTPFFVVQQAAEWKAPRIDGQPAPRRAGLSAFGAGGSNAHVVVEEFVERPRRPGADDGAAQLFVLSAKTSEALRARARQLAEWWDRSQKGEAPVAAVDIAYTLQTGREPMSERLAFVAGNADEALPILRAFANGEDGGDRWHQGTTDESGRNGGGPGSSSRIGQLRHFAEGWVVGGRAGEAFPFAAELAARARRVSLPGYPFARERCWFIPAKPETWPAPTGPTEVGDITVIGDRFAAAMVVLRPALAAALKIAPERIGLKHRFTDLGLDSVTAPIVLRELHRVTGIDAAPAMLMERNTVETFAVWLSSQMLRPTPKQGHNGTNGNGAVKAGAVRSELLVAGSRGATLAAPLISSRMEKKQRLLPLAPMDYLFTGAHRFAIQVLYHFPQRLDFAELRRGLHHITREFYPINSVLRKRGEREYILQEAPDHPDFAEMICPTAQIIPQPDQAASFAPFLVEMNPHRRGEKMAKFRLFQLGQGSLLSVNLSHAIADGYSYSHFLSSWAAACRGEDFLSPEVSRRQLIRAAVDAAESDDVTRDWRLAELPPTVDPLASRLDLLSFEGEAECARVRETAPRDVRERVTENGVLTALTWRAYARALPEDSGPLLLACPINFRRKASYLSPAFFGNAAAPALIRLPREQVLRETVWELALRISDAIGAADETLLARCNAAIDAYRRRHGLAAMDRAALSSPPDGLIVTNVARFMLPPVDFGAGPFAAELTPHNYAGTAVISGREGGPIQVRIAHPLAAAALYAAPDLP